MTGWIDKAYGYYARLAQEEAEDKIGTPASAWLAPTDTAMTEPRWECYDCGWTWPLPTPPAPDAECDACGGELERRVRQVQAWADDDA